MTGPEKSIQRRPDRAALVIAAALAVLALVIFWQTWNMPVTALYARIGPTLVPYLVAIGLLGLSGGTLWQAFRGRFPSGAGDTAAPVLWIVGGLVAQMLLLKTAGFVIATAALFALTARAFGKKPVWFSYGIGFLLAALVWLLFAKGLNLSVPDPLFSKLFP